MLDCIDDSIKRSWTGMPTEHRLSVLINFESINLPM